MNRKQKIIISIVGITIVLLALLSITYAYYLTRIQGNTNTNSISITTADLTLKYDDGSSYINLTNIMPGTTTDGENGNPEPKVFTVTNDGSNDVEYSVGMDEVTNTLTRTQDLTYSITCQEKLITAANTTYTACATTPSNSGEYPKTNSYLFTNQIKQDYIQKYTVVISYANPDEDQSIDMGSTIKGRMQIYTVLESIDITGTVTGATTGDYVQINSNPKTSVIASDGTYKLIGIEPGTHTLKVMNASTTKGTKEIIVKQGNAAGIDGSTITFTESERVATVNITSISTTLSVNITEIVEDTTAQTPVLLKDTILESAQKAASENITTRTIYSETPLTTPGESVSRFDNYKTVADVSTNVNALTIYSAYKDATWYYYDSYLVDATTGKFTLSGKHSCTYSSCYDDLIGKYLYGTNGSDNTNVDNHALETITDLSNVYKATQTSLSTLNYVAVFNSPNEVERVLTTTEDDYGTSYYYRGDVEDNYVNFAGMCWRIVRIEGDDSIKLILEDYYATCNDSIDTDGTGQNDFAFTGNWTYSYEAEFGLDEVEGPYGSLYYGSIIYVLNFLNYSDGLYDSFKQFQTILENKINITYPNKTISNKLKIDDWCYDDSVDGINSGEVNSNTATRISTNKKPSLKCDSTKLTKYRDNTDMYVGTLTADEISFAGGYYQSNNAYYLMNLYTREKSSRWWSLSPRSFSEGNGYAFAFCVDNYGRLDSTDVYDFLYTRPSVTLKPETLITIGDGTQSNPYVVY